MLSQKSSRKISVLSFILCLGVMTIHTYNLEVYGIGNSAGFVFWFETFMNRLANGICVPYFFVLSGFLFFRNFDMSCLLRKYKSRCLSILVPYIVWNTLYYLFFAGITRTPILRFMNVGEKMEFGLRAYGDYVWNGYYTLWFLRVLIWMILCAPVLWLLLKRRKCYWPEVALAVLVFLGVRGRGILSINIYYALGAYLGMNCRQWVSRGGSKRIAALAGVCFVGLVAIGGRFSGSLPYNCMFIAASWLALDLSAFDREPPWWVKCTFFYYCAHDMVLESVEKVILIVFGRSQWAALADYLTAPFITLAVLIGAAWVLRTYAGPVWWVLSGGRGFGKEGGNHHENV